MRDIRFVELCKAKERKPNTQSELQTRKGEMKAHKRTKTHK